MRCARCWKAVEQDGVIEQDDEDFKKGDPAWSADGCFVCEEYVGHDELGRFAPTHEIDGRRAELYDIKYGVHYDDDNGCPDCAKHFRRERRRDDIEFAADFFRMKLGYDKDDNMALAESLIENLRA